MTSDLQPRRAPATPLAVVRVIFGGVQTLIGCAATLLALFLAVFGGALAIRLASPTQPWGGIFIVGLSVALMLTAGVVTLLGGVAAVVDRHHTFTIVAAVVAITTQTLHHVVFRFDITLGAIGLIVFECASIPVNWLSERNRKR